MAVFAANITEETVELIDAVLSSEKITKFAEVNKLNLADNTTLIRLSLINLIKHLPTHNEIREYKIALMRPSEFDDYLREVQ